MATGRAESTAASTEDALRGYTRRRSGTHVSTLQDVAEAVGQSRSTAPEYLARFVDDIELCPPWRKWPFPPPKRGDRLFDPIDLVTLGVSFEHLAKTVPNDELRGLLQAAGAKLAEKGAVQM